jgi:hypothetical protein
MKLSDRNKTLKYRAAATETITPEMLKYSGMKQNDISISAACRLR